MQRFQSIVKSLLQVVVGWKQCPPYWRHCFHSDGTDFLPKSPTCKSPDQLHYVDSCCRCEGERSRRARKA